MVILNIVEMVGILPVVKAEALAMKTMAAVCSSRNTISIMLVS